MSTPFKDIADILGNDAESIEYNTKKREIEQENIKNRYSQLQEKKANLKALDDFDLENEDPSVIQKIADETEEYLLKAKYAKVFLNNDFKGKIPFFARNVILAGAETGVGKSTVCANLAAYAMIQGQKILILTNEENPGDVYNRITCWLKGWAYLDHGSFSDEQRKILKEMTYILSKRITVVSNTRGGISGLTTTLEGVQTVLNSLINKKNSFDLILIDYYQNIDTSTAFPLMVDWQVQYKFCKFLDQYKNISPATIVVLAQLKKSNDKELSFRDAIEGRKTILNISTCALRITKDAENSRTGFEIVKSRFTAGLGTTTYVGFKRGKFVEYTPEFKNQVEMDKIEKATQAMRGNIKPTNFNSGGS